MKAFVHKGMSLQILTMKNPSLKENEVCIQIKTAGLNRRDLYIAPRRGQTEEPLILGSDGAGIIHSVGEHVTKWRVGDEVIINPSLHWERKSDAPPAHFDILGMPDHGTFAEYLVLSEEQVEPKPTYLNWEEAGVLALSALTGYRALFTKGELLPGQTVFIPGAGSGVATFLIQFAKQAGARVIVSSRSEEKRKQAMKVGADLALETNEDWQAALQEEVIDLVIDSVGAATFNRSLEVVKKGGKIVVFGATAGDTVSLNLRDFFYGQYELKGSTMGSREELREMLIFMKKHQIKPVIDKIYSLDEAKQAVARLEASQNFGKIVIQIA